MKLNDLKDLFWDILESLPTMVWYVGLFILSFVLGSLS